MSSFTRHLPRSSESKKNVGSKAVKKFAGSSPETPSTTSSSFVKRSAEAPTEVPQKKDKTLLPSSAIAAPSKKNPSFSTSSRKIKLDTEGCDILFVDTQIKKLLSDKFSELPELQNHLKSLKWISEDSTDHSDRASAKIELDRLRKTIQDIEGCFDMALYIFRTAALLEEYSTLDAKTRNSSFVRVKSVSDKNVEDLTRKAEIVAAYVRIAKEYADLSSYGGKSGRNVGKTKPSCDYCHSLDLTPTEDSSILICKCGKQIELLDDTPAFKDSERVNMSSRYTYSCRGHFIEAINRFQAKQNTEIPQEVLDILYAEMKLHNLTSKTVGKDDLYAFLSDHKLGDSYADINLIHFLITKQPAPDITNYVEELLEMFDQLEDSYREVKDAERLNSLNVNWKLYKLLQLLDFPCKKGDFYCLKTPTKQDEHEEKWSSMISYLKTRYPNAKTSRGKRRWRHERTI